MRSFDKQLNDAAAGKPSSITIYWDSQDSENIGPAYRGKSESGPLHFDRWSNGKPHIAGYNYGDYFDAAGCYLGPDDYGVYPIFSG